MAEERAFGIPDGIEKRLLMWRRQLATDKTFPWIGTGLVADLECAAKMLGADVSEFTNPAPAAKPSVEYDL